jgi:hypothetical protein
VYRPEQIFEDPDLIDGLEIEEGILVEHITLEGYKRWDWHENEDSAREGLDPEEQGKLVITPGYRVTKGYYHEFTGNKEDVLAHLETVTTSAPGIYSVFLNVRDMGVVDWGDRSWDEGPQEDVWHLLDENDQLMETAYSEDESAQYLANHPGHRAEKETQQVYDSTDDAARMHRQMGCDGVLIQEVWDSGSKGPSESGNVLIVYAPENIKSADVFNGAFDIREKDIRRSIALDSHDQQSTHHGRPRSPSN